MINEKAETWQHVRSADHVDGGDQQFINFFLDIVADHCSNSCRSG